MRSFDWATSPLGIPSGWPQSLRTAVSLCLLSQFPTAVCWGPAYTLIYNDAYVPILGQQHPAALGRPTFAVWSELADIVRPIFDGVIATGDPTWSADSLMPMMRHGYLEEAYFTVFYSAIRGESQDPEGIFAAVTETTERFVAERRLRLVRDLAETSVEPRTLDTLWQVVEATLEPHRADVPFSIIYALDGRTARLVATTGIEPGGATAPRTIALDDPRSPWPIAQVVASRTRVVCDQLAALGQFPGGIWPEPAHTAVLTPIVRPGHDELLAVLVAGVNPRRGLDPAHLEFFRLVSRQIANACGNALAHHDSHRQAEAFTAANRELRRRVLEQQTLLDVLPIGIGIAMDRECREIRINRAFAKTLGLSPEANASKTAAPGERPTNFRVLAPDGTDVADRDLPMQTAAREGREIRDASFDVVHDDGRVVRLLEYAAPLFDEDGHPRGAVGAFVDVTASHEATRTLARSEARYRRIFDTAGVSLWEADVSRVRAVFDRIRRDAGADVEGYLQAHPNVLDRCIGMVQIVDANRASRRLFGAPDKQTLLQSLDRIFGGGTPEVFRGGLLAFARGDRSFEAEGCLRRLDGREVHTLVSIIFPAPDEPFDSVLVSLADITDRKAAETEMRRLYRDLEEASRLKDEFLATLSHELRTPLNAVLGWTHILREGAVTLSAQARALESIDRNSRALAQLVDDLLDVSRFMTGKMRLRAERVQLAAVVANAVDTVRAGATAKGLALDFDESDAAALVVIGDSDRLQQVVWNLASNAIKFTPAGGRIDIRIGGDDTHAEISVTDTGRGFSAEFSPHLFERFRQVDSSTARPHGGLGLGLSIVRQLVEAHGGSVQAESAGEGRGATFRVRLPLAHATIA